MKRSKFSAIVKTIFLQWKQLHASKIHFTDNMKMSPMWAHDQRNARWLGRLEKSSVDSYLGNRREQWKKRINSWQQKNVGLRCVFYNQTENVMKTTTLRLHATRKTLFLNASGNKNPSQCPCHPNTVNQLAGPAATHLTTEPKQHDNFFIGIASSSNTQVNRKDSGSPATEASCAMRCHKLTWE